MIKEESDGDKCVTVENEDDVESWKEVCFYPKLNDFQ